MKIMLDPGAHIPTRSHVDDAGLDLYARETKVIYPLKAEFNGTSLEYNLAGGVMFDTGVHMQIPHGWFGKIESRSGLNVKHNVVSCGGVIDSGFCGSIKVKLYNLGSEPYTVNEGDRIAQLILMKHEVEDGFEIVDSLDETERGESGIGSTGK